MVRVLLSTTVLGAFLFAASANAATDTPAATGATVTMENGVQVIRGSSETIPHRPVIEDTGPTQTINIKVTIDRRSRGGFFVGRLQKSH